MTASDSLSPDGQPVLVNLGCGAHFHPAWLNFDLVPQDPAVRRLDVRGGVPLPDRSCDAVYHSHVLEHLNAETGLRLLRECRRLLKPGGIIRVAVPDLESICRAYLEKLETARVTGQDADYDWMRLELLDQMVRTRWGGEMLTFLRSNPRNREFILSRVGWQARSVLEPELKAKRPRSGKLARMRRMPLRLLIARLRLMAASLAARAIGGKEAGAAIHEGAFRRAGEVHKTMYDSYSLARLLRKAEFQEPAAVGAEESRIPDFASYELDTFKGEVRKPDSLFMEAVRP